MKILGFTRICREIVDVAIYALYPESFCGVNLAIRKVFAFSDSGVGQSSTTGSRSWEPISHQTDLVIVQKFWDYPIRNTERVEALNNIEYVPKID